LWYEGGDSFLFLFDGLFVLMMLGDTSGGHDLLTGNLLLLFADGTEFEPCEAAGYGPSLTLPDCYKIMCQKKQLQR
jgi:hypothetical protein